MTRAWVTEETIASNLVDVDVRVSDAYGEVLDLGALHLVRGHPADLPVPRRGPRADRLAQVDAVRVPVKEQSC